jgi:hypothetical protein
MKDLDILITKNGRYIMIENMIYDKVLDRHGDINDASFSDLIDIISENVAFLVQDVKTNLTEISSFTRKNAYHVLECFGETDKRLSLMMEYEVKFGSSLLTESVTNPKLIMIETWSWIKEQVLVLEQTYNPFNKDFWSTSNAKQIGSKAVSGVKSLAKSAMDTSKSIGMSVGNFVVNPGESIKKGYEWVKKSSMSTIMEAIRDGLYSGVGTAIQIFLQFTGVGNVAVAIVWGAMLIYDLYKVFTGKPYEWSDILFDVLGIISGGAVKALKGAMSAVGITKGMSMGKGIQKLASNPTTKGIMSKIGGGISTVFGWIKKAGSWLSQKLGIKWVGDVVAKAGTWLNTNILKPIATGVGKLVTGTNNLAQGTKNLADKALQKTGNAVGLKNIGNKALTKGGHVTVGTAGRQAAIGGAEYKLKNKYIYEPGFEQAGKLIDKVTGAKPSPALAAVDTPTLYGLTADELAALA